MKSGGRFVILEHDHPFLHWDLLCETGDVAATWRLLASPEADVAIPAERIADHRLLYLEYEGPVSGRRGSVKRVASGTWQGDLVEGQPVELSGLGWASTATLSIAAGDRCCWLFHSKPL